GTTYLYDVIFLKLSLDPREAFKNLEAHPDIDEAYAGTHALYFRRRITGSSRSRFGRIVSKPVYKQMTIRNWNTTLKLLTRMDSLRVNDAG
ncbi:MAG: DUF1697 domain-containing protein, partial [Chloroflexi bacterium]|nr:DUF1697 domain-containing protein [Chloroflexota bacterium]